MSEETAALLAIGMSLLSIVITVVNVLIIRATERRIEQNRQAAMMRR